MGRKVKAAGAARTGSGADFILDPIMLLQYNKKIVKMIR